MVRFLGACVLAAFATLVSAQPPPVEQFFQRPAYSNPRISPDGKHVAFIVRGPKHNGLAVVDVETKAARPITNFADADVIEFHWVNSHRLALNTADIRVDYAKAELYGWYAINVDGSGLLEIGPPRPDSSRFAGYVARTYFSFLDRAPGESEDIIVEARTPEFGSGQRMEDKVSVWRWNTMENRRVEDLGGGELVGARQWLLDRRGVLRVARTYKDGRQKVWYRPDAASPWRILEDVEETKVTFYPRAFDFDNETFYVAAYGGADKLAIHKYDPAKNQLGERLARHPDIDLLTLVFSRGQRRLLGVRYDAERPGAVWLDEHMARVQKMIDRALPNTANSLSAADDDPNRVLVTAQSDVVPETYYLFDAGKLTLTKFFSSRPAIDSAQMSERRFVRYKARDGLEIPAYLTLPKGGSGKNLPLVVDIHGGPWTYKQSWDFDVQVQFLASRGYAVLQPDFRGTTGYGKRHFESSFKQWGYTMQDDITDGVEWAIAQGIADKNRVCLFGGSYGGYATLWGLMKTPDAYRCGVAVAALTDISYYFDFNRWDWGRAVWADFGARTLIGDPVADADRLQKVSPVAQAERIKAPVLLAHGGFDQRVPVKSANAMRAALDRYGKKYEWVVYPDEGHGFNNEKNVFDFYRRVDVFLKKHLSDPAALQ
jgi:dipeptidyl aminopeptidase/acylaminoacyl peptidase